jgi:hypothetical protein
MRNSGDDQPVVRDMDPCRSSVPGDLDRRASELYRRYGARPWNELPEGTRQHFRGLIRAGIDGAGRPLG